MNDVNEFVAYTNSILNGLDHDIDLGNRQNYFKFLWKQNRLLAFPHSVYSSYHKAILMLEKKANITKRSVSGSHVEATLNDFLYNIYYCKKNNMKSLHLHGKVQELFRTIRRFKALEYIVIIPVLNMKIEQPITIGNVEFVNLTPEKILELRTGRNIDTMQMTRVDERKLVKDFQGDSRHPTAAITIVVSSDSTKAEELAIQIVDQALNVLRFYIHAFRGIIKGEELKEVSRTVLISNITDKQEFVPSQELCNMIDRDNPDETIDNETLQLLKNKEINKLDRLLIMPIDGLSPLQRDVLDALFWIGNAEKDVNPTDKLVKYVAALDTLLSQDRRDKSETVAKRYTAIMNQHSTKSEVVEAYCKIKNYYTFRNNVLHAGLRYADPSILKDVLQDVRNILFELLLYADSHKTVLELLETIFPIREKIYEDIERCNLCVNVF